MKRTLKYTNLESAVRPVGYIEKLPVPLFSTLLDTEETQKISVLNAIASTIINKPGLKPLLLSNGIRFKPVPNGNSTKMKEEYLAIKNILGLY